MTPEIHRLTAILDAAARLGPEARQQLVTDTANAHGTIAARGRCGATGAPPLTMIEALGATAEAPTLPEACTRWLTAARAELLRQRAIRRAMATLTRPYAASRAQRDACETILTRSARFDHVMLARQRLMSLPPRPAMDHLAPRA
ncbi:hypothetical protein [Oceaniglobus trochenteri]|uniref:hypothetical protein n=1 Tax=Oceaniglobus trochenteri TaxID=2763260 RepID=UPI001CFF7748|nr:hypothetical protein [Oceaniglobus trochenteri]